MSVKLIRLQIENFRKLTAVELEFTPAGLIEIRGQNQAGKTSVIDAIEFLIRGKRVFPNDAIQHGKDECRIVGVIGDYEIRRTIKANRSDKIEVRRVDGQKMDTTAKNFLESLINELTFNPMPFLNMSSKDQLRFCMDLFDIDFTEIDAEIKQLEDERLHTGRTLKDTGAPVPVEKIESVDISEAQRERQKAVEFNNAQKEAADKIEQYKWKINSIVEKKSELEKQIQFLNDQLRDVSERIELGNKALENLPQPKAKIDLTEFDSKISNAAEINVKAEKYRNYMQKWHEREQLESKYKDYTDRINGLRNKKLTVLASVNTGIDGFQIKEDGLYHKGIFSENWSTSEGIAIATRMWKNKKPELDTVFLDRGESFDFRTKQEFDIWAKELGIQVIMTAVDAQPEKELQDGVIYIEDGSVIRSNDEEAANV